MFWGKALLFLFSPFNILVCKLPVPIVYFCCRFFNYLKKLQWWGNTLCLLFCVYSSFVSNWVCNKMIPDTFIHFIWWLILFMYQRSLLYFWPTFNVFVTNAHNIISNNNNFFNSHCLFFFTFIIAFIISICPTLQVVSLLQFIDIWCWDFWSSLDVG